MEVKDSKLRAQTLPPVAQSASKGRCADNFRTRYLASRCPLRLRQGWAVRPPSLQTSVVPHLITSWSKGRALHHPDKTHLHPTWSPHTLLAGTLLIPSGPFALWIVLAFVPQPTMMPRAFLSLETTPETANPPWAKVHTYPSPAVKLIVKDIHFCLWFPCFCSHLCSRHLTFSPHLNCLAQGDQQTLHECNGFFSVLLHLTAPWKGPGHTNQSKPINIVITTTTSIIVKNPLFLTWPFLLGSTSLLSPGSPTS